MTTPYNWADDEASGLGTQAPQRPVPPRPAAPPPPRTSTPPSDDFGGSDGSNGSSRGGRFAGAAGAAAGGFVGGMGSSFVPPINVTIGGNGNGGAGNGGGRGSASGAADRHQGDRLIYAVERIEFRNDRDILALAKAINHLGRELHLILGMRAEELNGVLSTYKGKWYTFGASSRVKARLVSAHLKVSAEAAKALGVGALKMAHAFDRHFVKPEQEAKQQRRNGGRRPRREFTIGGEN
ncbi:hypothetical protein AB0E27_42830 [Streptomyces sparsogenes]|uniref:hypothetical protein n=1 Tax=Streptomyces sparsogenes TaxID=67365 RepID=UPI0033EA4AE6